MAKKKLKRKHQKQKGAGLFIVIEGIDGSGKTTQSKRLVARLKKLGCKVKTFDFPQYSKPSSYFVKRYLQGFYGDTEEVYPKKASLFYALDRFDTSERIRSWLWQGYIVVSNRYVGSNLGHQGAKIQDKAERKKFFKWLFELEYKILGVPKPDKNILLHVPAKIAYTLIEKKGKRDYIRGARRDIHETNIAHLKKAEATYLEIVKLFPRDFIFIQCMRNNQLLSEKEVHKKVWSKVKRLLR